MNLNDELSNTKSLKPLNSLSPSKIYQQRTRKRFAFTIASIGITVGIFYYLFKFVSLTEVIQLIKGVDRNALAIFVALSFSMSFFRTWRYQILLRLSGYKPSSIALFLVVLVRNFFSDLLPARLGALIYIFVVNARLAIPIGPATSSFAIAFLFDILAVVPLILLAAWAAAIKVQISYVPLLLGGAVLGAITLILIYSLPKLCTFFLSLVAKFQFFEHRWKEGLTKAIFSTREEIIKTQQAGLYIPVMVLSLLVRITKYASLYTFLYALLHPIGYMLHDLHVPSVFLGICASELAASLPISGIAAFGAYEGTWAVTFELLGFPGHVAKLTAISHHLFTQVYGYLLGAFALIVIMLPFFKKKESIVSHGYSREPHYTFYGKIAGFSLLILLVLFGLSQVPLKKSEGVKNVQADKPTSEEQESRIRLAKHFPGRILFDSNRSGTFGIYSINANGTKLQPVIDDPDWHEMYPDLSPNGKLVVFSRAKTTSKLAPSEIWLVKINGANPRRVVLNGTYPTFSADGKTIYFERKRKKVMAIDVYGGNEREIFPAKNETFKKYQVVKPRVSFDGRRVAFTSDRKGHWNAWYADLESGRAFHISGGCEPVFYTDSKRLAWVNNDRDMVKDRCGIYTYNTANGSFKILADAGPPRGHEYGPTLAVNDRYLLYFVCRPGEHSHLTANYQIFVKDLKMKTRTRITFDPYTNRWPKLISYKLDFD